MLGSTECEMALRTLGVPSRGGGKNDDAADDTGTTCDHGRLGPCEATEFWDWALWGRLERGVYPVASYITCLASVDEVV
jgi:hypothetical protein